MVEQDTKAQREEQGTNQGGGNIPPLREVPDRNTASEKIKETDNLLVTAVKYTIGTQVDQRSTEIAHTHQAESPKEEHRDLSGENGEPPSRGVPAHIVDNEATSPADTPHSVSPAAKASESSEEEAIFMQHTNPFLPVCIAKILELIQIGEDVTTAEREEDNS